MWISKKKWNRLQFELDTTTERADYWEDKYQKDHIYLRVHAVQRVNQRIKTITEKKKMLETENVELKKQMENYKKMYLDEQQKRLELDEMVRKMYEMVQTKGIETARLQRERDELLQRIKELEANQ